LKAVQKINSKKWAKNLEHAISFVNKERLQKLVHNQRMILLFLLLFVLQFVLLLLQFLSK
jgi:hypothetical protein